MDCKVPFPCIDLQSQTFLHPAQRYISGQAAARHLSGSVYASTQYKAEFEQSQKAWLNYRDKQCNGYFAAEASQSQGEGPALIVRDCLAELTRQRLDYLKTLLKK
ncbi:lysozyme inhibitor LprI family protein [Burkholderia gladioli]|uniref:lysozyme inhibitor LprI family protein n=1 Tax=Burkholderia gladioli TaxID=28095 RepID=UPI001FC8826F|nr:lysozyme inhibitor LprI family protein [Burkholderia gladioli]